MRYSTASRVAFLNAQMFTPLIVFKIQLKDVFKLI